MNETKQRNDRDGTGRFQPGNSLGFQPGESGNPRGRPRGSKSGTAALRRMARQFIDPKSGLCAEELIASKLIALAIDGNLAAIREYLDRTEGKPGQRIEVEAELLTWQEKAAIYGLSENDVIEQAKLYLESATRSGSSSLNSEE